MQPVERDPSNACSRVERVPDLGSRNTQSVTHRSSGGIALRCAHGCSGATTIYHPITCDRLDDQIGVVHCAFNKGDLDQSLGDSARSLSGVDNSQPYVDPWMTAPKKRYQVPGQLIAG